MNNTCKKKDLQSMFRNDLSKEEQNLFRKIYGEGKVSKRDLEERECNIANQLVIKNMLVRKRVNDSIIYKPQAKAQYC